MPTKPQSLAEFELLVLLAALHLGAQEAYTVSIAGYIEQRTGRSVRPANVYTTLQRLEEKRLVVTRLGEVPSDLLGDIHADGVNHVPAVSLRVARPGCGLDPPQ